MKILGIDISSRSTGVALIEGKDLLEYTKINPTGTMSNSARMYLFLVELDKLILKYQPDFIAVEDVIQVSSVSVTKILARFNGIALISAYGYNKKEPRLFVPSEWKKIVGLKGVVRKCQTQLFVCEKFKLLSEDKIKEYRQKIQINFETNNDNIIKTIRKELDFLKRTKKKEQDAVTLETMDNRIKEITSEIVKLRKSSKKEANKIFDDISMQIYIDSGINEDIADATSIAIAYQKEICKVNET